LIKFEGHQTFDQSLKNFFVLMFDGRCFVRLDSRVSSMLMRACVPRLATHFNISMFGHQTMFDGRQTFPVCIGLKKWIMSIEEKYTSYLVVCE